MHENTITTAVSFLHSIVLKRYFLFYFYEYKFELDT